MTVKEYRALKANGMIDPVTGKKRRCRGVIAEIEARLDERMPWPEPEPLTLQSSCAIVDFDGIGMESKRPRRYYNLNPDWHWGTKGLMYIP